MHFHDRQFNLGEFASKDKLWCVLHKGHKKKFLLAASINRNAGNADLQRRCGLGVGHAYGIIRVVESRALDGRKVLQVRNPWGNETEWNGALSDGDMIWRRNPKLRSELDFSKENDGTFWIGFEDFRKHFSSITVCRYRESFVYSAVKLPALTASRPVAAVLLRAELADGDDASEDGGTNTVLVRRGHQVRCVSGAVEASLSIVKRPEHTAVRFCFEVLELDSKNGRTATRVVGSAFVAQRVVCQDLSLAPGVTHVCVVRAVSAPGAIDAAVRFGNVNAVHHSAAFSTGKDGGKGGAGAAGGIRVHLSAYASRPVAFAPFKEGDAALRALRRSALVAAALTDGDPLNGVDPAKTPVRKWQDEHGSLMLWAVEAPADKALEGVLVFDNDPARDLVVCTKRFLEREQDVTPADLLALEASLSAKLPSGSDVVAVRLAPGERRLLLSAAPSVPDSAMMCSWRYPTVRFTKCCLHCGLPVMGAKIAGKFYSGQFHTIEMMGSPLGEVHSECYHAYKGIVQQELSKHEKKHAKKCLHCGKAVLKGLIDGRFFSGSAFSLKKGRQGSKFDGIVHEECWDGWAIAHGTKCLHCSLPAREGKQFEVDGRTFSPS